MLRPSQEAPALGQRADKAIPTIHGRRITLAALSREGPVVLVLLRGFS